MVLHLRRNSANCETVSELRAAPDKAWQYFIFELAVKDTVHRERAIVNLFEITNLRTT